MGTTRSSLRAFKTVRIFFSRGLFSAFAKSFNLKQLAAYPLSICIGTTAQLLASPLLSWGSIMYLERSLSLTEYMEYISPSDDDYDASTL